ncbi:MAG: SRPBCC domain-containing protein [Opitutaceae bacterium]
MPDIVHRVGINVTPAKVFAALTTIDGLRHWWTISTRGNARKGGLIDFGFCKMRVLAAVPRRTVHWKCVAGPREWVGTEVIFDLGWKQRQTFVLFRHANWKTRVEFMHHCSTKWAVFMLSLRNWLERGEGHPAPYDVKIHAGD